MDEKNFMLIADRKPLYKNEQLEFGPFKTRLDAMDYQFHMAKYGHGWKIVEVPASPTRPPYERRYG